MGKQAIAIIGKNYGKIPFMKFGFDSIQKHLEAGKCYGLTKNNRNHEDLLNPQNV